MPDYNLYYAHLYEHICISLDTIARTQSVYPQQGKHFPTIGRHG